MGLQEKRVIKVFQEGKFITFKKQIEELVGDAIVLEVDWDSLTVDKTANFLENGLEKIYFISTIEAFKEIAIDDIGKEALAETLTKIVITNLNKNSDPKKAYSFVDGILTIDHRPGSNQGVVEDRKKTWSIFYQNIYKKKC